MKAILIKENDPEPRMIDINMEPETIKAIIGCDALDIPDRNIGDKVYCLLVDDMGISKRRFPVAVTLDNNGEVLTSSHG